MAFSVYVLHTIVCLTAFQGIVRGHVDVTPTYSIVKIGDPISMLCQASGSLTYCRILIPGEPTGQILRPNQPPSPKKLQYQGAGLEKGQCGFRIDHAEDIHNGVFSCYVHVDDSSIETSANMTLIVARTPAPPEMVIYSQTSGTVNQESYKEGDTVIVKCIARNSRPMTNFTWYLGDDLLVERLSQLVITNPPNKENLLTTEQNVTRVLQASDNDKEIRCIGDHPGLDERNRVARKKFIVNYPPKPSDKIEQFGLVEGTEGRISVIVEAHPRPTFRWNVGDISILEGEIHDRFSVLKSSKLEPGSWETVLIVDKLTNEDVDQRYSVNASNGFGDQMYDVVISTSPEPKMLPIGAGPMIIIVIIIVIVFIVIGGVLFARAKGRWCFADHVVPRITGESSDTESADHATSEAKPKRSFISVFKKVNDKVATIPEETPKVQMDLKPAEDVSPAVKDDENPENTPNDSGEGVVYAELDIQARNTEGPTIVRGEDDKTEYAEIIHTKSQPK